MPDLSLESIVSLQKEKKEKKAQSHSHLGNKCKVHKSPNLRACEDGGLGGIEHPLGISNGGKKKEEKNKREKGGMPHHQEFIYFYWLHHGLEQYLGKIRFYVLMGSIEF